MKCGFRLLLCAALLACSLLYLLGRHLLDLGDQYRAGAYLMDWWKGGDEDSIISHHGPPEDKVIVMAKLQEEDTDWVEEELPEWQRALYIVNPSKSAATNEHELKTPFNKGHESMAYLTYIIDHYENLPSTIAFLHSHRSGFLLAWHVDAPLHHNVAAMRSLQLHFVQESGYVNLRCNWNPGCKEGHRRNKHVTEQVWHEVFDDTSTPPLNSTSETMATAVSPSLAIAHDQKFLRIPDQVGAACCAQFAVSRDQVLKRPREDYTKFRQWVIDTDKTDASSGRVMEFLWHVIFGKDSVYCPDQELCYCQVYGQC